MTNSTEIIKKDTFSVTTGRVDNSRISLMRFYVFRSNRDGTFTAVKGYHRGSTYTSFWVQSRKFTPQTFTRTDLLERFKDCEFTDETSPY